MYYVIQVFTKLEEETRKRMIRDLDPSLFIDIFIPKKKKIHKQDGKQIEITKICFPGYIFIETDTPVELKKSLYKIQTLAKILGVDKTHKDYIASLSDEESEMLDILMGKRGTSRTIEISHILKKDQEIIIIDGPLKNFEGKIENVDLHRRTARVLVPMMNQLIKVDLGIEAIRELEVDDKANR